MSNLVKPVDILLVEDNPGDVQLTREAFEDCKIINNLHVAKDGEIAIDYLFQQNGYEEAIRPDIVLLDLNLPKIDGREVLQKIKSNPQLKHIPVVILTSSKSDEDILRSYALQANCYITKPINIDRFFEVVHAIESFWIGVVSLPHVTEKV